MNSTLDGVIYSKAFEVEILPVLIDLYLISIDGEDNFARWTRTIKENSQLKLFTIIIGVKKYYAGSAQKCTKTCAVVWSLELNETIAFFNNLRKKLQLDTRLHFRLHWRTLHL